MNVYFITRILSKTLAFLFPHCTVFVTRTNIRLVVWTEGERERERDQRKDLFTISIQTIDMHNIYVSADNNNCYAKQGKMIYPHLTMMAKFMLPSSICTIARSHVTFSITVYIILEFFFFSPLCWFEKCVCYPMYVCLYTIYHLMINCLVTKKNGENAGKNRMNERTNQPTNQRMIG